MEDKATVFFVVDILALKSLSKEEVFGQMKNLLDVALRNEVFIDKNEKENFTD